MVARAVLALLVRTEKLAKTNVEDSGADSVDPEEIARLLESLGLDWSALADDVQAELQAIAADGGTEALAQLVAVGVSEDAVSTEQIHTAAVDYARERSAELVGMRVAEDGSLVANPNAEWAITDSTRSMLNADVVNALGQGWSVDELADVLADSYAFSDDRAESIARTELATADVQGNLATYEASGVVEGKGWLLGSEHDDEDECDEAAAMGVQPLDSDWGGVGDPPAHPKCFLGHTLVSAAGVTAHFARWFEGEVVSLRVGGKDLTCTRNHPILTPRGWIAAGDLQPGEYVLQCSDPALAVRMLDPDDYHVETRIEQIAGALRMAGRVRTVCVPTTAEHFHGDGIAEGEVDVVRPARALVRDDVTVRRKPVEHEALGEPAPERVRLALGASVRSGFLEGADYHLVGDPALSRDLLHRLPGLVRAVEIEDVRKHRFAGHVYNLETRNHWYFAEGVISHNCVCDITPVVMAAATEGDDASDAEGE